MPFPSEIREKELIAAARHCCVCHRYKGLKIEVHHITPESEGGPNTFKNAISLCFDCHADAGHYNSKHPKGTKMSPSELVNAKRKWHRMVKQNKIAIPQVVADDLHFRYFMCKSEYDALDVINRAFTSFPIMNSLVAKNEVFHFWKSIQVSNQLRRTSFKREENDFKDAEEYMQKYPDAERIDKSDPHDPYFSCKRIPTQDELRSGKYNIYELNMLMVESIIKPEDYCKIVSYSHPCGSGSGDKPYTESLTFRSTWFVFLAVTNVSTKPIRLMEFKGNANLSRNLFRSILDVSNESEYQFIFPETSIAAGESVIIPMCVVSPAMDSNGITSTELDSVDLAGGEIKTLGRIDEAPKNHSSFYHLGPYIRPLSFSYVSGSTLLNAETYQFNLERLYTISTHWEAGCCPHLFLTSVNDKITYVKGLFTRQPGETETEVIKIPNGVTGIIIAELEAEETWIESIVINGLPVLRNLKMVQGEKINLDVAEGDIIEVVGRYYSEFDRPITAASMFFRNELVGSFMSKWYSEVITAQ